MHVNVTIKSAQYLLITQMRIWKAIKNDDVCSTLSSSQFSALGRRVIGLRKYVQHLLLDTWNRCSLYTQVLIANKENGWSGIEFKGYGFSIMPVYSFLLDFGIAASCVFATEKFYTTFIKGTTFLVRKTIVSI